MDYNALNGLVGGGAFSSLKKSGVEEVVEVDEEQEEDDRPRI